MENERGTSIIALVIVTIFIMIIAGYIINHAQTLMEETKLQDLRTNMLLIQAEAKKGLEEVCFRTVNLDETKEEDLTKINEIKQEYLAGTIFKESATEVQEATKNASEITFDENCYYLNEENLTEMGIKDINTGEYGYFIVKYDFTTAGVEVINTKGYNGIHTLTQLNQLIEGEPTVEEPIS